MPLSDEALDLMADFLGSVAGWMSLHSADPGGSGAHELSGGLPAYQRRQVTWSAAMDGKLTVDDLPVFDIPAGGVVAFAGLWSVDGVWLAGEPVSEVESFVGQGVYALTSTTFWVVN